MASTCDFKVFLPLTCFIPSLFQSLCHVTLAMSVSVSFLVRFVPEAPLHHGLRARGGGAAREPVAGGPGVVAGEVEDEMK